MLRDRGTIKWTSLMLPEHVELLKEMWREDKKVNMPILDEQELERINQQVIASYNKACVIKLSVYEDGMINEYSGKIMIINQHANTIRLEDMDSVNQTIAVKDIISIHP